MRLPRGQACELLLDVRADVHAQEGGLSQNVPRDVVKGGWPCCTAAVLVVYFCVGYYYRCMYIVCIIMYIQIYLHICIYIYIYIYISLYPSTYIYTRTFYDALCL